MKQFSTGMLVQLTSSWRQWTATFVVALYALCLMVPVAAYAFSGNPTPAHCLSTIDGDHMATVVSHDHHHHGMDQGGSVPEGADHALPGKCCGLFTVTALAPALGFIVAPVAHASVVATLDAASLLGRGSNRIDRPPRVLMSL